VPAKDSSDVLSSLSLALHPSGRWLVASRADDQVRVYDVSGREAPLSLPLASRDSKAIAFSPDGALLATLTSDDRLYVWDFDAAKRSAELIAAVGAVPTIRHTKADRSARQARWIDWIDGHRLGIATLAGSVLIISFDRKRWTARLERLTIDPRSAP
jgi:WD40 repeat protein